VKEQIIQLEPHDDINSARDKLSWVRTPRVLLVFPEDSPILRQRLDLLLLQREATRQQAELAIVTIDPVIVEHCNELGIPTFGSVDSSYQQPWSSEKAHLGAPLPADEDELPRLTAELAAFGLTGALILMAIAMLVGLPGAAIRLSPAANQVSVTTAITVDPNVDPGFVDTDAGVIAGRTVGTEVEGSTTVETGGDALEPSQSSRGIVLFTSLLPEEITVPADTIVRTSAAQPVRFRTLNAVTLPAQVGETVEVPVEALKPGYESNVPSNHINEVEGTLGTRVAVTNPEPTRGGTADEVRAISEEDMEHARSLLLQQLQQRALAEMQVTLLDEEEYLPVESLSVVLVHTETFSGFVGEPADTLQLDMRVTVQGIAVDERLARQVVYAELADKVGAGYQIGTGTLAFRRGEVLGVDDDRRVTLLMYGAGDVSAAVDHSYVEAIVRGKSVQAAAAALEQGLPLASTPEIEPWPSFWPWMPVIPQRITIDIQGQSS
jgi:hypothetical protein